MPVCRGASNRSILLSWAERLTIKLSGWCGTGISDAVEGKHKQACNSGLDSPQRLVGASNLLRFFRVQPGNENPCPRVGRGSSLSELPSAVSEPDSMTDGNLLANSRDGFRRRPGTRRLSRRCLSSVLQTVDPIALGSGFLRRGGNGGFARR